MKRGFKVQDDDGYHQSVMPLETVDNLVLNAAGTYLDATLGGAGHARAILSRLNASGHLIGVDRDPEALARAAELLKDETRVRLAADRFANLSRVAGDETLDGVLFDLGVSSRQLDAKERGFSFEGGTSLDMRMNPGEGPDAAAWLMQVGEEELAFAFHRNSDLQRSRFLAKSIKEAVAAQGSITSDTLRKVVEKVYRPKSNERNGLLARVFQAIRMEVNGELDEIGMGLRAAVKALKSGGRLVVLSYHSVEDRAVKEVFVDLERDCICPPEMPVCRCGRHHRRLRKVLRKPQTATETEVRANPRARSAKLRVMEKVS